MRNKVYTMTFHWATNYGAVLQAYALQKCLEQMGYDTEIINYVPKMHKKTLLKCFMTRRLGKVRKYVQEYVKERKIEKFRQKYLRRTKRYSSNKQLTNEKWGQATYICGSDQIWNPYFTMWGEGKPTAAYYLGFAPKESNKLAYAASFGTDEISESMQVFIKDFLYSFHNISVRENTAKQIITDLNLETTVVCDPVFLLERKQYEKIVDSSQNSKRQLFSYILHENQETARSVSTYVADTLKLEQIKEHSWTIEQWISNIKNSEFVITNSFHATAFALIFHIPFIAIPVSGSGMNDRILTLLENVNLKNRIVEDFHEEQVKQIIKSNIDWQIVDAKMSEKRKKSMDFLEMACKQKKRENCCGCEACVSICPIHCIKMHEDEEGFCYPKVDFASCIACGQCELVCPERNVISQISNNEESDVEAYAAVCIEEAIRQKSSSGGIFYSIAAQIIKQDGIVFGAAMSENGLEVQHVSAERTEDLEKLMGAKYVQSTIGDVYKQVLQNLKSDRMVLFVGTPCQVEALHSYLGSCKKERLLTIDFICHGVPSPGIWRKYLEETTKNVSFVWFRDKTSGWRNYSLKIIERDGRHLLENWNQNLYMKGYLEHLYCRPSCYSCGFKGINRKSDLTLGDFWRIQDFMEEQDDDKGTSLVFVHSGKGKAIFETLVHKKNIKATSVDAVKAAKSNPMMLKSISINKKSNIFWKQNRLISVEDNVKKCLKKNIFQRLIDRLKWIVFHK